MPDPVLDTEFSACKSDSADSEFRIPITLIAEFLISMLSKEQNYKYFFDNIDRKLFIINLIIILFMYLHK